MSISTLQIVYWLVLMVPISAFAVGSVVEGPNEIAPDRLRGRKTKLC